MNISGPMRRRCLIAAILVGIYTIVGFVVLPPIVKSQAEKRASVLLGRRVTIESVRMNPYTLSITLRNFSIWEQDGRTRFVGWERLYVNFAALSSLWRQWALSDVELDGLYVRTVLNPNQTFNFSDVLAKLAPPPAPGTPMTAAAPTTEASRPVKIGRLMVANARVEVSDRTRKPQFVTAVGPLSFELTNFRTIAERDAPYRFEAVTESGEKLSWSGTLRAQPFQSAGELRIENVNLSKYAPYYADRIQADVVSGRLSVRGRYEVDLTPQRRVMNLLNGDVHLREFALREHGTTTNAVDLPSVDLSDIHADALSQKASIGSVTVAGGYVSVRRNANGTINLMAMISPPAATTAARTATVSENEAPPAATPSPEVAVGEFAVKDFRADITDLATPAPMKCAVSKLEVSLQKISLPDGGKMPLRVAFEWAPHGTVQVDGTVGLNPIAADLNVAATGFAITPLSPYIEQFANVHVTRGTVSTTVQAKLSLPEAGPPATEVNGDMSIENLGMVDSVRDEDLAGFGALTMRGLRASGGKEPRVAIDEINVTKPYARVAVAPDGSMNLAKIAISHPTSESAPVAATTTAVAPISAAGTPKIEIGKITIADGNFSYADASLKPAVAMAVTQLGGTISGLSSTNPGKGELDLKGVVDGAGPVAISGKFDPLAPSPRVDMKIDVKNVDLLPLGPYSGKYAGYELARGKLFVDAKVQVDGKKIDAVNVITLNQFTFGDEVRSPEATKLPVHLAVALLKDIDGKIVIDVPIQGNMEDPDFKIGRVVTRVIVNLLTKAAVSPFSLLGAAFGGGGDELAYQEFAPGAAELQPAEMKKLETMANALTNRPGLNLDLEGSYDAAADAYALQRMKLADRVRRAIWEEKHRADSTIAAPEQLVITADENSAMIKKLFDETFPPGTKFGTPVPPPPTVTAPPPPPPGGWFQRVVRAITFADRRAERRAAAENTRVIAEHEKAVASAVATGLPVEEMTSRLAEATTVDENELRALAQARAQRVRDYLRDVGKISPERLFLAKARTEVAQEPKGPRVFLALQ